MKCTLADWIASRTIRFNAFMNMIWISALPVLAALNDDDFAALGISPKWVMIIMVFVKVLDGAQNMNLRRLTKTPLAGRADNV